jgi:hypothetical protein
MMDEKQAIALTRTTIRAAHKRGNVLIIGRSSRDVHCGVTVVSQKAPSRGSVCLGGRS